MRRHLLLAAFALAISSATANAQVITYDNTTTFGLSSFNNGGTASVAGILTTRSVMDDINLAQLAGQAVTTVVFSVNNSNATPTTARVRVRFYDNDGPAGAPGTNIGAFSFAAFALPVGGSLFSATLPFTPPDSSFWASMFFDNSGAPGTTAAQLDNLGQLLFDPPTIGTSTDNYFITTTAGVFGNNPPGTIQNFGGTPIANFGWQFQSAPEPGSMALFGFAAVGGLLRLRRKKA